MFTLPQNAAADLLGYIGSVVTDGWVIISIAIGIPLAFYVVRRLIGLINARTGK